MALILCGTSQAFGQWQLNGKDIGNESWRRSVNGFGAVLLLTNKPDDFFKEWSNPNADYQPRINVTVSANRLETITAVILFQRCKADLKGDCDTEVDFRVLRPDGSVYAEYKGAKLLRGKQSSSVDGMQLGLEQLGFKIEADDPLGDYRIEAIVRDKLSATEVPLVQILTVKPTE